MLILISDLLIASSCVKAPGKEDLYGVWQGEHHETELLFIFNSDETFSLSFTDNQSGETNELSGTFEVDFSKSPVPLSLRNIPQLNHGLYTIIEFTDRDSLIMADFSPRWRLRPLSFQNDTRMNLRRS